MRSSRLSAHHCSSCVGKLAVAGFEEWPVESCEEAAVGQSVALGNSGFLLGREGFVGALGSPWSACTAPAPRPPCRSPSSIDTCHSASSWRLVTAWARFGPLASCARKRLRFRHARRRRCGSRSPRRAPSSALMLRPVNSSSAARPWPMIRGRIAQAPMSAPDRPTRVNRKAVLASGAARRRSLAMAMIAPAPAQTPSTAATIGCGQARIARTRSPVMRVNSSRPSCVHLRQRADDLVDVAARAEIAARAGAARRP